MIGKEFMGGFLMPKPKAVGISQVDPLMCKAQGKKRREGKALCFVRREKEGALFVPRWKGNGRRI